MDWKEALEEERAALGRIVALLLALAGLAERAASRSAPVRGFVLWLLRRAEAAVLDFVGEPDTQLQSAPIDLAGNRPADAMRLALRLRALARRIDRQARLAFTACRGDGRETEPRSIDRIASMRDLSGALSALAASAAHSSLRPPAPDTS